MNFVYLYNDTILAYTIDVKNQTMDYIEEKIHPYTRKNEKKRQVDSVIREAKRVFGH